MSSRALRRLQGDSILSAIARNYAEPEEDQSGNGSEGGQNADISEGQGAISRKSKCRKRNKQRVPDNPFELLEGEEKDETEAREEEEGDNGDGDADSQGTPTSIDKNQTKAKKKKKKTKRKGKDKEISNIEDTKTEKLEDDVEASIQEVNRILGDPGTASFHDEDSNVSFSVNMKPLLHIDFRHLNPETELKRMFGSQVIRGEQQNQRNRRQRNRPLQRSSRLVQPKDTWHSTGGSGLSMVYLGEEEGFAFEHSPVYQKVQHQFCDAVESGHPENIINLLRDHPYHVDSLIQMADFYRTSEDFQTSAEFIEKALYGLECAFHPMFNLASGNCYLNYKRPENRPLFLCLFKHILNLGRRGCNRTAFEFCKLLLSLDPIDDPLDCMSMIDYYALRSEQYDHLVRMEREVMVSDTMKQVPNFALSIPLAYFKIACRDGTSTDTADKMLQDKMLFFPMMLMPLLDQCCVQPDKKVSKHPFFSTTELHDSTSELQNLVTMYVKRCETCWKDAETMSWLERNINEVMRIVDSGTDKRPEEYAKLRRQRFRRPPLSLLRHYVLSEVQGLSFARHHRAASFTYDPFPPRDSIVSYSRPPRQTVASEYRNGVLRSLLQSLLPSFNPNEPVVNALNRRQRNAAPDGGDDDDEGAGARAIPFQIQNSVQAIMDAMRQLLNDPFTLPVANQQNEGDAEDAAEVEENERGWEEEEEEFQNNQR